MIPDSTWVNSLHPKRQKEFFALPMEHQALVLERSDRTRRTALRVLDHQRRGINGREQWVSGLEHLQAFVRSPDHFFLLAFEGQTKEMEAMTDILIDFRMGEHENVQHTDPRIYDLMSKANAKFVLHGYDRMDALGMALYFKKHPERRPLKGRSPDPRDVVHKKAMTMGAKLKQRRREMGLSRADLAQAVGSCEKTIKHLETGRAVSSHTFLMAHRVLSKPLAFAGSEVLDTKKRPAAPVGR